MQGLYFIAAAKMLANIIGIGMGHADAVSRHDDDKIDVRFGPQALSKALDIFLLCFRMGHPLLQKWG